MGKPVLFFLPLLLLGCARDPANTSQPQFDFMNNPDNGNPRFLRFQDQVGFLLIDQQANLFSVQSPTNRQFLCVDPPTYLTFADVQQHINTPDDLLGSAIHELRILKGAYVAVYQGPFPFVDCADLFARKLAEGIGSFRNTDNDLITFLRQHSNFNAFGFVAQGKLQLVGGGRAMYNGVSKCVWDGVDGVKKFKCVDKINFH